MWSNLLSYYAVNIFQGSLARIQKLTQLCDNPKYARKSQFMTRKLIYQNKQVSLKNT